MKSRPLRPGDDLEFASKLFDARPDSTYPDAGVKLGASFALSNSVPAAMVGDDDVQPIANATELNCGP